MATERRKPTATPKQRLLSRRRRPGASKADDGGIARAQAHRRLAILKKLIDDTAETLDSAIPDSEDERSAVELASRLWAVTIGKELAAAARMHLLHCIDTAVLRLETFAARSLLARRHLGMTLSTDEAATLAGSQPGVRYAARELEKLIESGRHNDKIKELAQLAEQDDPAEVALELFSREWPQYAEPLTVEHLRAAVDAWSARGGQRERTRTLVAKWKLIEQLMKRAALGGLKASSLRVLWAKHVRASQKQ